jgi:hypothetical protein
MRPAAPSLTTARRDEVRPSDSVWIDLEEITEIESALPVDVERTIRATAQHLDRLDPHSLIGVDVDAPWSEIEHAYRQRLAIFHPNRWSGYDLADLRESMERISLRISFAFAFLAEEAALDGTLGREAPALERTTEPVELADLDLSDERPTYPSSVVQPISREASGRRPRARPPRPPPRKTG